MELREVLRRLRAQQGIRRIHTETGMHRTLVRALRDIAEQHGWLAAECELPSEEQIQEARRSRTPAQAVVHPLEAFHPEIQRWVEAGHSYVVMHQLLGDRCPCSEATLRRFVQKRFPQQHHVSVRRPTTPRGRDGGRFRLPGSQL